MPCLNENSNASQLVCPHCCGHAVSVEVPYGIASCQDWAYSSVSWPYDRRLERHAMLNDSCLAFARAGKSREISRAIMDMTTSNSMSVKPHVPLLLRPLVICLPNTVFIVRPPDSLIPTLLRLNVRPEAESYTSKHAVPQECASQGTAKTEAATSDMALSLGPHRLKYTQPHLDW